VSLRFVTTTEESFSKTELHLQCGDLYPHVVCNVETWLDHSVLDNEVTISSYCLLSLDVAEYCCTLGTICHTMSHLPILKTWNCWDLYCTMVIATVFVSMHSTVHIPPLTKCYCMSDSCATYENLQKSSFCACRVRIHPPQGLI